METIHSVIDAQDEQFNANKKVNRELLSDLHEKLAVIKRGGGEKSVIKHRERKKLLPRERIESHPR